MCGLVGFMGTNNKDTLAMFKTLLYIDVMRGPHSTGVGIYHEPFSKKDEPSIEIFKEAVPAWDFLAYHPGFNKYTNNCYTDARLFMGHNRWKTIGDIKDENSHPFQHGDLVGAQNGTLTSFATAKDNELFEVDSDWAIWRMSNVGVKEAIAEMHGAWAFTVFDKAEKKLYITRNAERPIFFAFTKDKKGLFWASQKNMLIFAADEHRIQFDGSDKANPSGIWTLDPHKMAIFDLPEKHAQFKWCEVVEAPGAPKQSTPLDSDDWSPWRSWGSQWKKEVEKHDKEQQNAIQLPAKVNDDDKKDNVVSLDAVKEAIKATFGNPPENNPISTKTRSQNTDKKIITPARWAEITQDGCAACGGVIRKDALHKIIQRETQVLCMHCCDETDKNPYWGMLPKEFEEEDLTPYVELTRRLAMLRVREMFGEKFNNVNDKRSIN